MECERRVESFVTEVRCANALRSAKESAAYFLLVHCPTAAAAAWIGRVSCDFLVQRIGCRVRRVREKKLQAPRKRENLRNASSVALT